MAYSTETVYTRTLLHTVENYLICCFCCCATTVKKKIQNHRTTKITPAAALMIRILGIGHVINFKLLMIEIE